MISHWKLYLRRVEKANWAECSSGVWFFSVHQHLMFFLFFAWVADPLPPTLLLILAGAWLTGTSLPWRLWRWRSCLHSRTQTFEHTQTQTWKSDRLSWVNKLLHSVAPWKVASLKKRQVLRLSCHSETPQLFHPSQQKWMGLAFLFILSNINLSFG